MGVVEKRTLRGRRNDMKNGKCPKCNSESIVMSANGGGVGYGQKIYISLGLGMSATSRWMTYLCLDCGYFENYVVDQEKLDRIRSNPEKSGWKELE
jgi:predicted nucleic-acid-binding Zn-ribbon protein